MESQRWFKDVKFFDQERGLSKLWSCHTRGILISIPNTSVLKKLDVSQLWVWKRAVCFLPYKIISFRQKKNKVCQKYPNFIRRDPNKLGQTPVDQKEIQKWNYILEGSRHPKFMNPLKLGPLEIINTGYSCYSTVAVINLDTRLRRSQALARQSGKVWSSQKWIQTSLAIFDIVRHSPTFFVSVFVFVFVFVIVFSIFSMIPMSFSDILPGY